MGHTFHFVCLCVFLVLVLCSVAFSTTPIFYMEFKNQENTTSEYLFLVISLV